MDPPGVTKECFLEALKYLKTSKQHTFETPGIGIFSLREQEDAQPKKKKPPMVI